jgi:hypothetical protein
MSIQPGKLFISSDDARTTAIDIERARYHAGLAEDKEVMSDG